MDSETIMEDGTRDAGDLGCGKLVLHLRNRLRAMPGKVLKLIARIARATAILRDRYDTEG